MKTFIPFIVLGLCSLILAPQLRAQGTAFTYQGRLNDGAGPAIGNYDLQFTIYDSTNVPGNIVAGPITNSATMTVNGLFTVSLDFGVNVFLGEPRWLAIAVRTNAAGVFTTLAPRQPISAVPYAMTARDVTGNVAAGQLTGTIQPANIGAGTITSVMMASDSIHSNHLADGAVTLDTLSTALSGSFPKTVADPSPGFFEYFGVAVAAVGTDKLLIGAREDSTGGDNAGAAYLLNVNGSLLQTFLRPIGQNQAHFGISVAAVGPENVLIGADADDIGATDAGAAYLFNASGTLITTFTNPTPALSDFFGYALAAVGTDKVLIGAHGDHFGANVGGAAYLFSTNRTLLMTFNNPTPSSDDRFGIAVAAVGANHVLIGADRDDQGATDAGVAHLFDISGALVTTFTNPTPAINEAFGSALTSVSLDQVIVGAPGDNSAGNAGGAAYLFSTSGTLLKTFANPTPESGDQFGTAITAMGGSRVLIGAASDNNGATDGGAAYLFNLDAALLNTFNNPAPANGDLFGNAVAVVGADKILIGAFQDDASPTDSGAAYLFTLNAYMPGLAIDPAFNTWVKSGSDIFYNGGNVGIGTANPLSRLHVVGNIQLGSTGQFFAPAAEENVRVVRGVISAAGSILAGQGFTVTRTAAGSYTVTFTASFTAFPTVTVSGQAGIPRMATTTNVGQTQAQVRTFDGAGVLVDTQFHFIAVGPR